jgi:DNA invertase Pin-like site-specific DNA recombinase
MVEKSRLETSSSAPNGWRIGYARVSTHDQNLDLQMDALKKAGCERIYQEKASGKTAERPELDNCLKALRPGDRLIVWKLDRLGRSLPHLIDIINKLQTKDIFFESLTENIDTGSPSGKLVFHVFAALADFEKDLIQERVKAGLVAARLKGRIGGRPRKLTHKQIADARLAIKGGLSLCKVAKMFGVSKSTLHTRLRDT